MSRYKFDQTRLSLYRTLMPGFFGDCWRYHLADHECNKAKYDINKINRDIGWKEHYVAEQEKGRAVCVVPTGSSHADDLNTLKSRLAQAEARLEDSEKQRLLCLKKYEFARSFDSRNDIGSRILSVATTPIAFAIWTLDACVTAVYHLISALCKLALLNSEGTFDEIEPIALNLIFAVLCAIATPVSLLVEAIHLVLAPIVPNFDDEAEVVKAEVKYPQPAHL